jgi:hypothetical protein
MIVAELTMLAGHGMFGAYAKHRIRFDDINVAQAERRRVGDLLKRKTEKANDLPLMVDVAGCGGDVSFPLETLHSVSLCDFATANEHERGLRETFPALFRT